MDRLLVSAAHKSSGKTTISVGLCAALAAQGTRVQPFKKGPDYIDPMWLAHAAGRPCLNLDPYLMDDSALERCFREGLHGAELALVEGNKGLHDGMALDGSNSNAALAARLGLPVLLVVDARGMTRGVAPLLLGFQAFDRRVRIAGVILNRVGGSRHEGKLRAAVEHYTDIPVLGSVAEDARLALDERHLGLVTCGELGDARDRVQRIGRIVGGQIDLGAVRAAAASAAAGLAPLAPAWPVPPDVRIAIARDRAFSFYYPDDLAALFRTFLADAGIEVVAMGTLGIIEASQGGTLSRERVLALAAGNRHPDAQAILLPDTALHTMEWLTDLQAVSDVPVLTANQVTIWEGLRLAGHPAGALDPLRAFGIA